MGRGRDRTFEFDFASIHGRLPGCAGNATLASGDVWVRARTHTERSGERADPRSMEDEHSREGKADAGARRSSDFDLAHIADPGPSESGGTGTPAIERGMVGAGRPAAASARGGRTSDSLFGMQSVTDRAMAEAIGGSLVDRAIREAAGGSFAGRMEREAIGARLRFDDLMMGRAVEDARSSTIARAEVKIAEALASTIGTAGRGSTTRSAIEEVFASIGDVGREHLLGRIAGVGSLATIAMGLADPLGDMGLRTSRMVADAQRKMDEALGVGVFRHDLRAAHADLFPPMRAARASEFDAVASVLARDATLGDVGLFDRARARLETASVPWVRVDAPEASIEALSRFGRLGALVDHAPPGGGPVVAELRARLGDYRDVKQPEPEEVDDPIARTGFQLAHGFDPVLSDLPTSIVLTMFEPLGLQGEAAEADPDQVENAVRMFLKRLERALRTFIGDALRRRHGDDWLRHVPGDVRRDWERKRTREAESGRPPEPLIHYADLDHYRRIIERPRNWTELFEPVFRDQAAIRETLRRIAIVRNPNSHFRAVTVEDLIILRGEATHLSRWLGVEIGR